MKKIDIGGENFAALRQADAYYVDKTELIYDLFGKMHNKVTLFTRPRRFGKTLTMSMIESFFSIKENHQNIFTNLNITKHEQFCIDHMNQYPVIFISLKDVEGLDFNAAYEMLINTIADFCKMNLELMDDEKIAEGDRITFHHLCLNQANKREVKSALKTIMRMFYTHYGKKVILLIDEYDVPLAKAQENGYYREMLDVIRGLLNASLKFNDFLEAAVLTGCLRIPKESIFTGVNHFVSYGVMDKPFSQYFGFTGDEVKQLLAEYNLNDKNEMIRSWYDGYHFGNHEIYCPWDVMNYVSELLNDKNAKPKNYWENSSHNEIIYHFLKMGRGKYNRYFESLMNREAVAVNVSEELTYDSIYSFDQNIWTILLMTGYLTVDREIADVDEYGMKTVSVRIPNNEIQIIFQKAVNLYFTNNMTAHNSESLIRALWDGDERKATEILSNLLWVTISYMDYSEAYYHAFLAGVFVGLNYDVKSNKERGLGRPDIIIDDYIHRRAVIIEAKKSDSRERMNYWCHQAIDQIDKQGYDQGFDGYQQVLCYGVAFYKKEALIVKRSND